MEQVLQTAFADPLTYPAFLKGQRPGPGQFCSSNEADRLRRLTNGSAWSSQCIMIQLGFDECKAHNAVNTFKGTLGVLLLRCVQYKELRMCLAFLAMWVDW